MSGLFGYSREAVRVKVKKCEPNIPPEWRKFSVDPQITSVEVLYSILAKAFDLKSDFGISYRALDPSGGQETYLPVLSDWDLDAAFLRSHNFSIQTASEPCLNLRIDIKPFSVANEWEANSPAAKEISTSLQQSFGVGQKYVQNMQNKLPGLIMNQMEKTFSLVQRALNLTEEQTVVQPLRPPLSDGEFRKFLDSVGQILHPNELRRVIFAGGIDPSLRRVVWKHILNVYPTGMTGRERMDYMKRKAAEYYRLRDVWRIAVQRGPVVGELAYVTSMVRKDVLRTDRLHPFYAGSDDNQNIASLFNILTTFALNHPSVSYCQGMSDIASPLLVTMGDEAHAYICFCAIMTRLKTNFMLDGIAMTQKFTHLSEALQFYDPEFYEYLKMHQADDLLFCYRWLLLEMKREFAFEDALRMLEVLWSSMHSEPPLKELELIEMEFQPPPLDIPAPKSPSVILRTPRENAYTKVCALRRQSSSASLNSNSPNQSSFMYPHSKLDVTKRMNQSLDENIARLPEIRRTRSVTKAHQSLDESKMLMLMEKLETAVICDKDQQSAGDKEICKEPPEEEDEEDNNFIMKFHPTNPFIDETSLDCIQTIKQIEDEDDLDDVFCATESPKNKSPNHRNSRSLSPKKDSKLNGKHQRINKNLFSNSAGNIISKQMTGKKGGHFKDLKEKIAAGKKGILASLERMDSQSIDLSGESGEEAIPISNLIIKADDSTKLITAPANKGQKVVKNLNEFLSFASINKSRISDKMAHNNNKIHSVMNDKKETNHSKQSKPLIKLTKNSLDDSDSSTVDYGSSSTNTPSSSNKPMQLNLTSIVAESQMSLDGSSPDDSQDYYPMTTSMTRELRLEMENLDRQVFGESNDKNKYLNRDEIGYEKLDRESLDLVDVKQEEIISCPDVNDLITLRNNDRLKNVDPLKRISTCSGNTDVFLWENPLHQISAASSCNFNDMATVNAANDEQLVAETLTNGMKDVTANLEATNQMTPDEQQELEYDGDIVIETNGGGVTRHSVTPLRLVQQKSNNSKQDESDSDNTDSWNIRENLNPFLSTRKNLRSSLSHEDFVQKVFFERQQSLQETTTTMTSLLQDEIPNDAPQLIEEAAEANVITNLTKTSNNLPSPSEFGGGNPFLMFLCLTLLLQHRHFVMKSAMDYNEMAMHFDKMVRKHDVTRVLNQARRMYGDYLKTQRNFELKLKNSIAAESGGCSDAAIGGELKTKSDC